MLNKYKILSFPLLCLVSLTLLHAETDTSDYTLIESEVDYPILTPSLEKRQTAKIKLQNGMQVYLISDPDVDQSAASVSVEAGSWQDPEKYPGMAHFLEHMLFMGNKAYPDESEYAQYIQDNGGTLNAFTAPDRTVYMFSINNNALSGALDRFSHFFIDPLFNPSCINRELLAVDQENSKNIEHDGWREYMVLKETGNPKHPNQKFSTGNAQTLSGIPQEALKEWYHQHYNASQMHLIMLSNLPIDQMKQLAVSNFSSVPNNTAPEKDFSSEPLLSSQQKGNFIYIKPVKDLKNLSLVWELPKEFTAINERGTGELISYALEQASSLSLIQELKKEGLAESLHASTDRFGRDAILFNVVIKLTNKGLSQVDTVILRCFQALARLKQNGLPLASFQELQTMAQINYQYQSREEPFSWITSLANEIVDEDLATFPEKTMIPTDFDPQSISKFLKALTPESCAYFIVADPSKSDIDSLSVEKWYGVQYTIQPIPSSKLLAWQQAAPNPNIQTPPLNPYVLTSVPVSAKTAESETSLIIPKLLVNNDQCKIYYASDETYLVPESSLSFNIKTPTLDGSAKSFALMDLFSKSLREELSSTLFFASRGGLSAGFSYKAMQFSLNILGYSEKAPELMRALFKGIKTLDVSQEHFDTYKTSLLSTYSNDSCELPIRQASQLLSSTLLNDSPLAEEKLKALHELSFEEFTAFYKEWLSESYLEGMIYGSLDEGQAASLAQHLQEELSVFKPYLVKNQKKQQFLLLPKQEGPFKINKTTTRQGFATILAIQEGAFSFSKKASQQIVSKALHEAFYKTLRTQQQTGYIAQSSPSEIENQLLHTFMVQSSSYAAEDLLYRFELFLSDFNKRIEEIIPEERFNLLKEAQVSLLEMPPENLSSMASRLTALAFEYNGDFERVIKRVNSLKELSYESFLQDVNGFLTRENFQRLAVLVKGEPTGKPFLYQEITQKELEQLGTFTSSPSE
jgi:insulysin